MTQVLKKSKNLQILISTKGKKDLSFLDKMFKNCNPMDYSIIVVDQSESEKDLSTISKKFDIKYYNIQANGCLLYTSPSPRDRTRSRMPSSA